MRIKEAIVVEGKDDAARIKSCLDARIIITHGYGLNEKIYQEIEEAYKRVGIIIFTDPDTVGARLRRQLLKRFPQAKEAFIEKSQGTKDGDIGVENASCEDILAALERVRTRADSFENYTMADLVAWGLVGPGSADRRKNFAKRLGIEGLSAKSTLEKLNYYGISLEEIQEALSHV